jgi:hypothetical protein
MRCSRPLCSSQNTNSNQPRHHQTTNTTVPARYDSKTSPAQENTHPQQNAGARSLRTQQCAHTTNPQPRPPHSQPLPRRRRAGRYQPGQTTNDVNSQRSTHEHTHPQDTRLRQRANGPPHPHPPGQNEQDSQMLLRKEVIQPHLPVRLPCYDFVPIAGPTFDGSPHKG